MGVDGGMEPQEQGGVSLGSAPAIPEALLATITEGGGPGQRATHQGPGEQSALETWETTSSLRPQERPVMASCAFFHGRSMFLDQPSFLILSDSILEAELHGGI